VTTVSGTPAIFSASIEWAAAQKGTLVLGTGRQRYDFPCKAGAGKLFRQAEIGIEPRWGVGEAGMQIGHEAEALHCALQSRFGGSGRGVGRVKSWALLRCENEAD
jgi:hypothetical protein